MKSNDLLEFYDRTHLACAAGGSSAQFCLRTAELEAYNSIVTPISNKYKEFAIIVVSRDGIGPASHELAHAQYFLNPIYRATVNRFWLTLSSSNKMKVKAALAPWYDVADEYLVKNEMQAYLLEDGSEFGMLAEFTKAFRPALIRALQAAGAPPVVAKP
jgi:hypothetical protein